MIEVSIIIVHFNTPQLTKDCIQSIIEKTKGVSYEIIVVDNASTIHDADELKEWFPVIELIKSTINAGFAGGNNLGIAQAKGRYILLLNSDTVLVNDAVSLAVKYLQDQPKAGVVSAQLLYPDGRVQSAAQRFPSIKYSLIELLRLQKLLGRRKRGRLMLGAFFDHKSTVKADWVWGTFFMFPKEILSRLRGGKLDDAFFMYGEDKKWCFDIRKAGYEVHYYPEAKVIHYMGGSSGKKNELIKTNEQFFLKNNYTPFRVGLILFLRKLL